MLNFKNKNELNQEALVNIAKASQTAKVTISALSQRERDRDFSNLTSMKEQLLQLGEKIVDDDYYTFWKSLQDLEVGMIVYGRRGGPDRFKWNYSLKHVAELATETIASTPTAAPISAKTVSDGFVAFKTDSIVYRLPLNDKVVVEVVSPVELSKAQLKTLFNNLT